MVNTNLQSVKYYIIIVVIVNFCMHYNIIITITFTNFIHDKFYFLKICILNSKRQIYNTI